MVRPVTTDRGDVVAQRGPDREPPQARQKPALQRDAVVSGDYRTRTCDGLSEVGVAAVAERLDSSSIRNGAADKGRWTPGGFAGSQRELSVETDPDRETAHREE